MIELNSEKCMGCEACGNICPKEAVTFSIKHGFRYPVIDSEKCIDCNLCKSVCPAIQNEESSNNTYSLYAAWTKDESIRTRSTSGGICYELSKYIIEQGGCVAGVVWNEDFKDARYELINNLESISKISQTKYFQPQMNNIFQKIKERLDNNQLVLFIGTSCSCSGLRLFLRMDYPKLICCDFICRGYTSQLYHQKRVEFLEDKFNSKIINIQYKNKDKGWRKFGTKFWFKNGKVIYINRYKDSYELMFSKDDFNTRPSCYDCKFRCVPKKSDITVGDFWAVQNISEKTLFNGISAVIISTKKGVSIFDCIKKNLNYEERTIKELSKGNYALLHQLKRKEGAETFFDDLEKLPFEQVNNKYSLKPVSTINKVGKLIRCLMRCDFFSFVFLNFISKNVKRKKHAFIFPIRGTKVDLAKSSKLEINKNLYLNFPKHKHSNEQTYLKISEGGVLQINGISKFAANNTIEINKNARFITGKVETNYGTTIVCGNEIEFGDDIGIGRNVTIYDNNFHSTGLNKNIRLKPLVVGDHVWICTGVTIVKGVKIEAGAICSINSTVTRNIAQNTMVAGNPAKEIMANVKW